MSGFFRGKIFWIRTLAEFIWASNKYFLKVFFILMITNLFVHSRKFVLSLTKTNVFYFKAMISGESSIIFPMYYKHKNYLSSAVDVYINGWQPTKSISQHCSMFGRQLLLVIKLLLFLSQTIYMYLNYFISRRTPD